MTNPEIRVAANGERLAVEAAKLFTDCAASAIASRGRAHVCLAGGSAPIATYERLSRDRGGSIDWEKVNIYFGDERCVSPDRDQSNYRMASNVFLGRVGVPTGNIHRIKAELGPERSSTEYERTLRRELAETNGRFDLVLLGMGVDGHTLSIFPGHDSVRVKDRWCVPGIAPVAPRERVTLTFPVINSASMVVFLVSGCEKAESLRDVLACPVAVEQYPAAGVCPSNGRLIWLLDEAVAALLPPELYASV